MRGVFDRSVESESFAGTTVEYRFRTADDDWVWLESRVAELPEPRDGYVISSRDVTDRRRRERQLLVMDNLLRHNLRNDLGIIIGTAELIAEEAPAVAGRTTLIRETAERLLQSADKEREVIDLMTGDASRVSVDLSVAVRAAAETVRDRHPAATVETSVPDDTVCRAVDTLGTAIVELVENAVTHTTADDPTVVVEVTATADRVTLTVADDAPPIPEMEARVLTGDHEMTRVSHSSGLGVWLVYWVVTLSDGEVTVESAADGNRVRVTLPQA